MSTSLPLYLFNNELSILIWLVVKSKPPFRPNFILGFSISSTVSLLSSLTSLSELSDFSETGGLIEDLIS